MQGTDDRISVEGVGPEAAEHASSDTAHRALVKDSRSLRPRRLGRKLRGAAVCDCIAAIEDNRRIHARAGLDVSVDLLTRLHPWLCKPAVHPDCRLCALLGMLDESPPCANADPASS